MSGAVSIVTKELRVLKCLDVAEVVVYTLEHNFMLSVWPGPCFSRISKAASHSRSSDHHPLWVMVSFRVIKN